MSYTITKTSGVTIATILDGTVDTAHTSLTLVGRNYSKYGQLMVDNFVGLLENFAHNISPQNPLSGQIWYDTTGSGSLKVWTGATWQILGSALTTSLTDAASYSPLPTDPLIDGLIRYNKTLNGIQVQAAGMWHNTADSSLLAATGQYGPTQDPTSTSLSDLRGINYPVKWSQSTMTSDITGNVAFGSYIPADGSNDLGGINIARSNQNNGSPFNARFGGIHAMNVKVYSSVMPGNKQVGDPTEVTVGTSAVPFDAAYVGNVTVGKNLLPLFANVSVGSAGHPFNSAYLGSISVANNITPTTAYVSVGNMSNPLESLVSVNATITNVTSFNASADNLTITGTGLHGSGSIMPDTTQVYDIGSQSLQFGNLWADTGNFNNINIHGVPIQLALKAPNSWPWTSLYNIPTTLIGMGIHEVPWTQITGAPITAPPGFDIPFTAGFTPDFNLVDLKIQPYGQVILARNMVIQGEVSALQRVAAGSDLIVDILKNGSSVYINKPGFAAGSTTLVPGVLDNSAKYCNAGDIIQFVVVQIGSTSGGAGLNFTVKGHEV